MPGGLASGAEPAAMGEGDAQVLIWIDGCVVDADFVVEVRAGRTATQADVTDHVAAVDFLAGRHGIPREVAIPSADAMPVIEHDGLAVSAEEVAERDHGVGRSNDLMPQVAADVHAGVERAFTIERIDALAKAARNLPFNR